MSATTVGAAAAAQRRGGRRRLAALVACTAVVGIAGCTWPGHPHPGSTSSPRTTRPRTTTTRPPTACRPVDWDEAHIGGPENAALLIVTGRVTAGMTVSLDEVQYEQRPEYWEMTVIGCIRTDVDYSHDMVPFDVRTSAGGWGTKGIELVGATMRQRFDYTGPGIVDHGHG